MEFCPNCGAMLLPSEDKLKCNSCGYIKDLASTSNEYSVSRKVSEKPAVVNLGEAEDMRSQTTEICPECGHDKAYSEIKQTRSADEAPTRFFTCTACKHSWREYS